MLALSIHTWVEGGKLERKAKAFLSISSNSNNSKWVIIIIQFHSIPLNIIMCYWTCRKRYLKGKLELKMDVAMDKLFVHYSQACQYQQELYWFLFCMGEWFLTLTHQVSLHIEAANRLYNLWRSIGRWQGAYSFWVQSQWFGSCVRLKHIDVQLRFRAT